MNLSLIYAPNPIFSQKAQEVPPETITSQETQNIIKQMWEILRAEHAVGLAGNLVGVLKRIVVIDLGAMSNIKPITMINPQIIEKSLTMQSSTEASVSFPGISVELNRADKITVKFLNEHAKEEEIVASDFLAAVIQHEIDYLDGITFLDHVSKMKRDLLLKKVKKHLSLYPFHMHGPHCQH